MITKYISKKAPINLQNINFSQIKVKYTYLRPLMHPASLYIFENKWNYAVNIGKAYNKYIIRDIYEIYFDKKHQEASKMSLFSN